MLSKPVGSVSHQSHQLPGHAGEVSGNVSGNVLRVLRSHFSTSQALFSTTASVHTPEQRVRRIGAGPCPAAPRPSRKLLAPPRALRAAVSAPSGLRGWRPSALARAGG